jgi:Ca2+-binding EF-hand superfamily protein
MGNVVGGGSASPGAEAAAGDTYLARLSDAEIKRYAEGYRRICRSESGGGGSAGDSSPLAARAPSAGAPAPSAASTGAIASAFLPRRGGSTSGSSPASAEADASAPVEAVSALAGGSGVVSKKLFRNKVLGTFTMIPHSLSDRLFEVLDTERSGELTLDNVLRGIAWLKHGTFEEQVQLLFIIYDLDGADRVARDVLDRFMDVIYGRKRARHRTTVEFLDGVFNGRASLSIDEFRDVVQQTDARGDALLVKWLATLAAKIGADEDADILELERKYNPVVIRHRIADATEFTVSEVAALERQFQRLFDAKSGASARVPSEQFVDVLSEQNFPQKLLARFATATALPQVVTFDEFCQFVSDFCRGTRGAKMRHLFRMYKDPDSGRAQLEAIEEIIRIGAQCDAGESKRECDHDERVRDEEQQLAEVNHPACLSWTLDERLTSRMALTDFGECYGRRRLGRGQFPRVGG